MKTSKWPLSLPRFCMLSINPQKTYPVCIGGAWAFMALKQKYSMWYIADRLIEIIEQNDVDDYREELHEYQYWLHVDRFDRRAANQRLKQYATGDDAWRWQ
jgi:hypothetical protein